MLMEQLRQIMENFGHSFRPGHKKAGPESVQLLLCADFNSLPQSGVIEFIKNGRVPTNHQDLKDIGYAECLMKMLSHSNNEKEFLLVVTVTQHLHQALGVTDVLEVLVVGRHPPVLDELNHPGLREGVEVGTEQELDGLWPRLLVPRAEAVPEVLHDLPELLHE